MSGIEIHIMPGFHPFISETKKIFKSPSDITERGYFKNPNIFVGTQISKIKRPIKQTSPRQKQPKYF